MNTENWQNVWQKIDYTDYKRIYIFFYNPYSVSFTDLQDIAEPQASQEDADKIATVSQTDGTDSTAVQDTTQADTAAIGDSVKTGTIAPEDTTEVDSAEADTASSDLHLTLFENGISSGI